MHTQSLLRRLGWFAHGEDADRSAGSCFAWSATRLDYLRVRVQCAHPEKEVQTPTVITDCIVSGLTFAFEVPSNRPFYGWVGFKYLTRGYILTRAGLKPTHGVDDVGGDGKAQSGRRRRDHDHDGGEARVRALRGQVSAGAVVPSSHAIRAALGGLSGGRWG